jgi:hypothetical protein
MEGKNIFQNLTWLVCNVHKANQTYHQELQPYVKIEIQD